MRKAPASSDADRIVTTEHSAGTMPRASLPATSRFRETELGCECRCAHCNDWWPADAEFFYMHKGVPHSWCKACYSNAPSVLARRAKCTAKQRAVRELQRAAGGQA
jgi:hypothetical protein